MIIEKNGKKSLKKACVTKYFHTLPIFTVLYMDRNTEVKFNFGRIIFLFHH